MENQIEFAIRVANLNVAHPKIERIWSMLDTIRKHNKYKMGPSTQGKRHISVIGASGVGKTQMGVRYAAKNPEYKEISEDGKKEVDIKPVIYFELPDPFTVSELYKNLAHVLGAPEVPKKITIGEAQRQAFKLLGEQKVEVVVIDEVDYILTSNVPNKTAMNAIKKIANKANVTLVLMGTPEVESLININFQNFRRYPKLYMQRFSECNEEWCDLLKSIEKQLNPPQTIGFGDLNTGLPELLHGMSYGLVGRLTPLIQEYFGILGIFDETPVDESKFLYTEESVNYLLQAYVNINGDMTEEEMEKMLKKGF